MRRRLNTRPNMKHILIFFLLCGVLLSSSFFLFNFFSNALAQFLNVNKPIDDGEVLIVEGWINSKLLVNVKEEFEKRHYKYILVSEMDNDSGSMTTRNQNDQTYNNVFRITNELITLGINTSKIRVVTCHTTIIHKTFSMAQSARNWLRTNDPTVRRINICTGWSHGRKSWCAYQRIFGSAFCIGILTYPQSQKPVEKWWLSRGGRFRSQLFSLTGYIYSALWPISLLD